MMIDLDFCGYDLSVIVSKDNFELWRLKSRLRRGRWLIVQIQMRSGWMENKTKNPH